MPCGKETSARLPGVGLWIQPSLVSLLLVTLSFHTEVNMWACLDWLLSALQLSSTHQEGRLQIHTQTQNSLLAKGGAACEVRDGRERLKIKFWRWHSICADSLLLVLTFCLWLISWHVQFPRDFRKTIIKINLNIRRNLLNSFRVLWNCWAFVFHCYTVGRETLTKWATRPSAHRCSVSTRSRPVFNQSAA